MARVKKRELPIIQRKAALLSENARVVLFRRYLKKDEKGNVIETPEEMFWRIAEAVAAPEKRYGVSDEAVRAIAEKYYDLMATSAFLPNSPTLMNAGREMGMLSACFVLPVKDSIESIFDSVKYTALIQKAGGGTGFDFSDLRPKGDIVRSSGGTSPGPICFMRVFSDVSKAIQQGAFRRGANMGMLSITHPDILDFIKMKEDLSQITNFNISVSIPDAFMETLKRDPNCLHRVTNPRTKESFPLKKPDGTCLSVGELFNLIVEEAHATGEPGVVFIDAINQGNPTLHLGEIHATNPCGEQPLLPFEACNLGSINLEKFVMREGEKTRFDFASFAETVRLAAQFLDDVVDATNYPVPQIQNLCLGNRKIGLGIMGFANALFRLAIRYDSEEAVQFGEQVMKTLNDEAHRTSEILASQRGVFPNWKGSSWEKEGRKMRNACVTTIAPTGTISIIANCSSGIEPLFALAFYRYVLEGERLPEVNPTFKEIAIERGFYSDELIEKLAEGGSLSRLKDKGLPGKIPQEVRHVFVTAHEVTPEWHLRMQEAFQKHCDSSISKTINFPRDALKEDVAKIFRMAYELKLKGVTVYRDGSRAHQPMALAGPEKGGAYSLKCPDCNSDLTFEEGCITCHSCAFTEC
ncbi:MAG: adenosylcobalamin-dependent ribonucleoside-diphosphate reductase [Deltaproteobacteria bacterium]|nr:adenosylcobalamin-dependent ribonucleoside-diphosphate reductase [Deltaproteobacteria bacterium]